MTQYDHIKAFFQSNLDTYLDLLKQMVAINSFTSNPAGVNQLSEFTADIFSRLGFTANFLQAANPDYGKHLFLFHEAKTARNPTTLAMISHLDTVFSPDEEREHDFQWRLDGDRIYGPGTVDIKGGTVMIFMILDAIQRFEPELLEDVSWAICIDACEEALSYDFSQHCLDFLPRDTLACLVFEGGNINQNSTSLVTSRKGRATFRVTTTGRSAHAGNSHQYGANAIVQMAKTVSKIAALTDYERDLTFNVGVIRGGSVVNRVPHYAEAEVEMRVFSPQVYDEAVKAMLSLDGTTEISSQDGFRCSVSVQLLDQMSPWPRNRATENLIKNWQDVGSEIGIDIGEEARGGLSDGNPLSKYHPTLDGLGPVGANAHCSEHSDDGSKEQEYVTISSFVPKALLNTGAIIKLLQG